MWRHWQLAARIRVGEPGLPTHTVMGTKTRTHTYVYSCILAARCEGLHFTARIGQPRNSFVLWALSDRRPSRNEFLPHLPDVRGQYCKRSLLPGFTATLPDVVSHTLSEESGVGNGNMVEIIFLRTCSLLSNLEVGQELST